MSEIGKQWFQYFETCPRRADPLRELKNHAKEMQELIKAYDMRNGLEWGSMSNMAIFIAVALQGHFRMNLSEQDAFHNLYTRMREVFNHPLPAPSMAKFYGELKRKGFVT